jgi:uncharacterized caspase-like protein
LLASTPAYTNSHRQKLALVIGNSEYQTYPKLENAQSDAKTLSRALSEKGFTVFLAQNVTSEELKQILMFTSTQAGDADQILIYYAGHSKVENGITSIVPIDGSRHTSSKELYEFSVSQLLSYFDMPFSQKAIIIDACLQIDPHEKNEIQNLSLPDKFGLETLVVFATSFGQAAYDGKGKHSVFTGALLDFFAKAEFDIQDAIHSVRRNVITTSRSHQVPISISTLTHPYILASNPTKPALYSSRIQLIQSYSNTGYSGKQLLGTLSNGFISHNQ